MKPAADARPLKATATAVENNKGPAERRAESTDAEYTLKCARAATHLIVEKDELPHAHMIGKRGLSMYLPASVTSITVPRGFLEPATSYMWEVLAIEESGRRCRPANSRPNDSGGADSLRVMVPPALRRWFVVHFIVDVALAIPLFVAPVATLGWFGWTVVDPSATRLVAAALFGIGLQSWLGRNESAEIFRAMLTLKVIWSAFATVGLLWSQLDGGPPMGWAVMAVFAGFNLVWGHYLVKLRRGG